MIFRTLALSRSGAALGPDTLPVRAGAGAQRRAALTLARKRRFGPFGAAPLDRPAREKQIAAMLRAGHGLDLARAVIEALVALSIVFVARELLVKPADADTYTKTYGGSDGA